ncbi:hypothetical protein C2E23DRAFT_866600 [Lenzites betulinus]|nr:hypothetical protein C2E23DRAFT_866600 [Lenzites betulinus]
MPLKTYSVFEAVRAVLAKKTDIERISSSSEESARRVVTKTVNILSARREMGGPAACSYLLGHPQRYTNRVFKVFFWSSYVKRAMATVRSSVSMDVASDESAERIVLAMNSDKVVGLSKVNDYVHRPIEFNDMCLYEYMRTTDVVRKATPTEEREPDSECENTDPPHNRMRVDTGPTKPAACNNTYAFLNGHPSQNSHMVRSRPTDKPYVLNFSGGVLPRVDRGDKELYCATMLVLFGTRGWREGNDLMRTYSSWSEAFDKEPFRPEHLQLMSNMNVLYECLDARDDYASHRQYLSDEEREQQGIGAVVKDHEHTDIPPSIEISETEHDILNLLESEIPDQNPEYSRKCLEMDHMRNTLQECGYHLVDATRLVSETTHAHDGVYLPVNEWKNRMNIAKTKVQEEKRYQTEPSHEHDIHGVDNAVYVVTQRVLLGFTYVDRSVQDKDIATLTETLTQFNLNKEQQRAFVLIARPVHHRDPQQLRMYLGGMAGTGKSQVLKALTKFMALRNELYRLMILAPTGSSACNIDGSTYHSALCLGRDFDTWRFWAATPSRRRTDAII